MTAARRRGRAARWLAAAFAVSACLLAGGPAGAAPAGQPHVPVFAYFYQWFDASSWDRAKIDFPSIGKYSSDDPHVLRTQVREARAAGIDGFLTSWKDTPTLDRRLDLLTSVAQADHLALGVVYEALDFNRNPLPVAHVRRDLVHLVTRWGAALHSQYFARPLIIWTGTDDYSTAAVRSVQAALGGRAYLLAASKSVDGYRRVARFVDGEAYYWSSADPTTSTTRDKLDALGAAVHADGGIWIAPATCGFDGRPLGHTRVIDRLGGQTLIRSLDDAYASRPDAVGVISWNEWSENTYLEPGQRYGFQELDALRDYLRERAGYAPADNGGRQPNGTGGVQWTGFRAALALAGVTCAGIVLALLRPRRTSRRHAVRPR